MAHPPRAEAHDNAAVEEAGERHRPGHTGKGIREDVGRAEHLEKDLLRAVDEAEQRTEGDAGAEHIAQRLAMRDHLAPHLDNGGGLDRDDIVRVERLRQAFVHPETHARAHERQENEDHVPSGKSQHGGAKRGRDHRHAHEDDEHKAHQLRHGIA